jgi:hypothetical protein
MSFLHCEVITMRMLWIFSLSVSVFFVLVFPSFSVFPCSSNCYQCHTDIPSDAEHKVLKSCTDCHPDHSEESLGSKCGADCFDCHPAAKVMKSSPAHSVLSRCVDCHKKLSNENPELNELYNKLLGG